jgi:hypothetical protein
MRKLEKTLCVRELYEGAKEWSEETKTMENGSLWLGRLRDMVLVLDARAEWYRREFQRGGLVIKKQEKK